MLPCSLRMRDEGWKLHKKRSQEADNGMLVADPQLSLLIHKKREVHAVCVSFGIQPPANLYIGPRSGTSLPQHHTCC